MGEGECLPVCDTCERRNPPPPPPPPSLLLPTSFFFFFFLILFHSRQRRAASSLTWARLHPFISDPPICRGSASLLWEAAARVLTPPPPPASPPAPLFPRHRPSEMTRVQQGLFTEGATLRGSRRLRCGDGRVAVMRWRPRRRGADVLQWRRQRRVFLLSRAEDRSITWLRSRTVRKASGAH